MTGPVEAVQPAERSEQTDELDIVAPTDHEADLFQKAFGQCEVGMQQVSAAGMDQVYRSQMGIIMSNVQAAQNLFDRDD